MIFVIGPGFFKDRKKIVFLHQSGRFPDIFYPLNFQPGGKIKKTTRTSTSSVPNGLYVLVL